LQRVLSEGERLAAERHGKQDRDAMQRLDAKLRAFNPLMNTKSALFKKLKEKKKRKRDAADVDD
jgi:hypothetical protein